jgi:RNA polymerase sigma-70 factor (ECF subfamily)
MHMHPPSSPTSPTLLGRLHDPLDQDAWAAFVNRYGGKIYGWCLRRGLQEADAQDVTQGLLMEMPRKMRLFVYDPSRGSFHGWLCTVTRRALADFRENQWRNGSGAGDTRIQERLESLAAEQDLLQHLNEEFDLELLEEAEQRVRLRVDHPTWEAFRLTAVEDRPGKEVATALGIKVAAVYVYRNRVQKMLHEEVERLTKSDTEEDRG